MSDAAKTSAPKMTATYTPPRQLNCARFSPDGAILAAGGCDAAISRWSIGEKEFTALPDVKGHNGWVTSIEFHPKQKQFFSADSWGQLRCQESEGESPKTLWQLDTAHDGWLRQIKVSADGAFVATCGRDQAVRAWSPDGKLIAEHIHDSDLYSLEPTPDGSAIVFGDLYGNLHVWDFKQNKILRKIEVPKLFRVDRIQEIAGLRVLQFLNGGKTLLAAGTFPKNGGTVQGQPGMLFLDFATGKEEQELRIGESKEAFIHDLAVHPAGYLMAVTSGVPGSGQVFFARPGEAKPFHLDNKLPNCQAIALHPDGKRFIVTSTNRNSNGNGRRLDATGKYPNNTSPVHVFELV